jgi:hypothetical protein
VEVEGEEGSEGARDFCRKKELPVLLQPPSLTETAMMRTAALWVTTACSLLLWSSFSGDHRLAWLLLVGEFGLRSFTLYV